MSNNQKIFLVLPYFGPFKNYFQLFLDSVGINRDILKIILITDQDLVMYSLPDNINVIQMRIEELRKKISFFLVKEYNFQIVDSDLLEKPYKLCDLRPAYFSIFESELAQFKISEKDYIGWCDCDLIFGKISNFISLEKNYEVLGIHGHFTAFKNTNTFKLLYQEIENFPTLIVDKVHHLIDERHFREKLFTTIHTHKYYCFYMDQFFCDIQPWQFKQDKSLELQMVGNDSIIKYLKFDILSQKLIIIFSDDSERETTYVHLQKRDMKLDFDGYQNSFYILKNSFEKSI